MEAAAAAHQRSQYDAEQPASHSVDGATDLVPALQEPQSLWQYGHLQRCSRTGQAICKARSQVLSATYKWPALCGSTLRAYGRLQAMHAQPMHGCVAYCQWGRLCQAVCVGELCGGQSKVGWPPAQRSLLPCSQAVYMCSLLLWQSQCHEPLWLC